MFAGVIALSGYATGSAEERHWLGVSALRPSTCRSRASPLQEKVPALDVAPFAQRLKRGLPGARPHGAARRNPKVRWAARRWREALPGRISGAEWGTATLGRQAGSASRGWGCGPVRRRIVVGEVYAFCRRRCRRSPSSP